jgi:hypothetical protein
MIVPCESFPQISASAATRPASAAGFALSLAKNYFAANSTRYRKFSERAPIRALDAGWIFAALPRVRARLAELRAARFATLHIVNHQQTRERRARPPRRVKHSPPGGRVPIRAVFISASEDEP